MDLPEIRTIVAIYLSKSDLCMAIRVCKSWQASFGPELYSAIDLSSRTEKKPHKEAVINNAGFIRKLCLGVINDVAEIDYLHTDKELRFPGVTKLFMEVGSLVSAECQFEILRKCPQLKDLRWSCFRHNSYRASDICGLFKTSCPFVESLNLSGISMADEHISQILDHCYRVTHLTFPWCKFGELAFRSLTRHFGYLKVASLRKSGITSKMTQGILAHCPTLTKICGAALDARDIIDGMEDHSGGWICTRLETLNLFICGLGGKPLEWHRKVFQQLSRMHKLGFIINTSEKSAPRETLEFRVEAGLDLLSSLKEMKVLSIRGSQQQMREQDVRWMLKEWPDLDMVCGTMNGHRKTRQALHKILIEQGVQVYLDS
ncbi:hypothetical protein B0O80DRAFT_136231 [Mortierella sp. GBAus27b]|nr:hypothetical protein B0O80DRAFT_136231 [Mortierella sp. GBAus27b]